MTATLNDMAKKKAEDQTAEQQAAVELVRLAKSEGLDLTGPDGLLKQLTKTVLESALDEEMTEHLGYGKRDPAGVGSGNIRNGTRGKTVLTGHDRFGRYRSTSRSGGDVRAADCEAAAAVERCR